jgi:hypothetical protein
MSFRSASRSSTSRKKRGTYARQLGYETLEGRQLLAVTSNFVTATGTWEISMGAIDEDAEITLVGGNYKVNGNDPNTVNGAAPPPGFTITQAAGPNQLKKVVATGTGTADNNKLTISAQLGLESGFDVSDDKVEEVHIKAPIVAGAAIIIGTAGDATPTLTTLESDIDTLGTNVTILGEVKLVGGARSIETYDVTGTFPGNGGNVELKSVTAAALSSLTIDARGNAGFTGGTIKFDNVGVGAGNALGSFQALTTAGIDFAGGDTIQTDGGAVILQAATLDLAGAADTIDTEVGADAAGGAVNLSAVSSILYTGAPPQQLTIDTTGVAGQAPGAVTLNTTQFVEVAPTAGFDNYQDAVNNRVNIRVAVVTNFAENFVNPNAFNQFTSRFFTQQGTNFVSQPPVGRKAIAVVNPVNITPPLSATFKAGVTATVATVPGRFRNGYIVFDVVNNKNFKFAGAFTKKGKFSVGEVKKGKVIHRNTSPITPGSTFDLSVRVNTATGSAVLSNSGVAVAGHTFANGISSTNGVGMGANNARTAFTNFFLTSP